MSWLGIVFGLKFDHLGIQRMPETVPVRTKRFRLLIVFGVILISAALGLALKGKITSNLCVVTNIGLGTIAGYAAFRYRRLRFFLAISSALLFLGVLEIAAQFYESNLAPSSKIYSYRGEPSFGWMAEHALVGYAFQGPAQLWATATLGDEILFDSVFYSIDPLSRRKCAPSVESPEHALFFGGSFAFGEGLSNQQMIACQFQTTSEMEYQSYNYGMMGWGAKPNLRPARG